MRRRRENRVIVFFDLFLWDVSILWWERRQLNREYWMFAPRLW